MEYNISQGQILVIDFPYADQEESKLRPALVLSSKNFNKHNIDIICCGITSNIHRKNSILIPEKELNHTGLHLPSSIIPHRIIALHKNKIHRISGSISKELTQQVKDRIMQLITET